MQVFTMTRKGKNHKPINNVSQPAPAKKQEAEGSEVYSSSGFKFVSPKIDTKLIEQYSDNALLAEPLKNIKDLVFTSYEDHPTPWVTIKDPEGNIDDDLSKQGQQIAKVCDFYNAHITAFMDEEKGGCSVWSPGWGTIDGVTGVCPVELRNLPWNSFRDLPMGFYDTYNDIMPGIVLDQNTGAVRIFQKKDDRSNPVEIVQTAPLPSWLIVRDPTTPKPAGKAGCLPVVSLITKYNHADHAMDQKMNRIGAPIAIPLADITKANKDFWEGFTGKWGKDTVFVLPKGTEFADLKLAENSTAEDRLAWLKKRIDGFYNPATFVQKDGNTIGGSDSGAASMVNKRTVSTLSQLESGLGEVLLQIWLDINGFIGYTPEVRFPRPETQNDQQVLNEITEANKNGHISRTEARQKYPNLDLPELTPEEEAKMDAEYEKRKPQQSLFGANPFGQPADEKKTTDEEIPVGNLSSAMPVSQTERELLAATRQCAADVKRIVKGKVTPQYPHNPTAVPLLQRVKNIFTPVNNTGDEGSWVTINGVHILIKEGETAAGAFERTTGQKLSGGYEGSSSSKGSGGESASSSSITGRDSTGHREIQSVESKIHSDKSESAAVYSKNGDKIISKSGSASDVQFSKEEMSKMKGGIFTHNHPPDAKTPTFSPADYGFAANADLSEMRAVSGDRVYVFTPGEKGWPPTSKVSDSLATHLESNARKISQDIKSGKITKADAEKKVWKATWNAVSKECGFGYTVEARK